jgi:predicted molibdopterin-dependent oxidoreductase YjgC
MPKSMKARLTQPLVRENGSHRPATWDEAMDRVAAAFRKSIAKKDPRDFGMFSCSKTVNELNYAAQKFVRSVMARTISIAATGLDTPPASPVWRRYSERAEGPVRIVRLKTPT